MASNSSLPAKTACGLPASQVYTFAAFALLVGLAIGYYGIGAKPSLAPAPTRAHDAMTAGTPGMPAAHPIPTMEQMKAMAAAKTAPLLDKLKGDPKNTTLLNQIAGTYDATHQFKDAAECFRRSLEVNPNDNAVRTAMASDLYYSGDTDAALAELQKVLKNDPKDVNALFNLGMIRFKGKNDPPGAIAAWRDLLKAHPDLDRRSTVEKMIEEAQKSTSVQK